LTADRRLAGWVARDLETHLDQLAATARKWRDGAKVERTLVTFHLASGQRHTGYVLDRMRTALAVQSVPQRGSGDLDVTIIPIAHVEALTLHAAQALVEAAPVPESATSMLDLRRRMKQLADALAARLGHGVAIEHGSGEVDQLGPLFEQLRLALDRVCADDLGRAALGERVQRIELRIGNPGVSLANGTIVVGGPLAADRLQLELDAVL
jgi:hypothetical protein